ncbi:MAG: response regulator [Chitinophagaceae bacterium]|nr:MAG: response regulator [Chitinophagaceae bacterium]
MYAVLIIEDNAAILENTAEILELAGYKVATADNGKTGVELAIANPPDLIICDIMMPQLDGYGVLHLLRKNASTENVPFIFLTAKTERRDLRKGMEMGADDYITKPFEEIELLNAVEIRLKKNELLKRIYPESAAGISQFVTDTKAAGLIKYLEGNYAVDTLAKKQVLFQEGKKPRFVYYIVSGKIKSFRTQEDGKEYITDVHGGGDFMGYTSMLTDRNYEESAVVLEPAELMAIPKDDFLQMIYNDMSVAMRFIQLISNNIKEKEQKLIRLAYSSLRKRVAAALVDLHGKSNDREGNNLMEISRDDIAHYIGTATESLIRTLGDFKSESLIEVRDNRIHIKDLNKLSNLPY